MIEMEKPKRAMEQKLKATLIKVGIFLLLLIILAYYAGTKKAKCVAIDLSIEELTFDEREPKYKFMPKELSNYICDMCENLGDDSDLPVAILMKENAKFDPNAININPNGTVDVGMFQENDLYLWTTFKERYWHFENVELNPFNWKHNTYIALHHIHYLKEKLGNEDDIIMAYNCGENRVMNGDIPNSTLNDYLPKVKNNLYLLRNENNNL